MQTPEHLWRARTSDEEGRCWCQPFPHPDCGVVETGEDGQSVVKPIWLHRPHGCVFWDHGEQGPQWDYSVGTLIESDPVLDDLDLIAFTEDRIDLGLEIRGVSIGRDEIAHPFGPGAEGE